MSLTESIAVGGQGAGIGLDKLTAILAGAIGAESISGETLSRSLRRQSAERCGREHVCDGS